MPHRLMCYILLLLGNLAGAASALLIKECRVPPLALSGWRLILASVLLAPWFWRACRRHGAPPGWQALQRYFVPSTALAIHFVFWAEAVPRTTATNASLVVNMVPLAMPLFLWIFVGERLTRAEWFGTAIALAALCILGHGDWRLGRETLLGDALAFASMLVFCWYMIMARQNRDLPTIVMYVAPLYLLAGCLCLAVSAGVENPPPTYPAREWLLLFGLALIPTVIGHSIFNWAMQRMRGQVVSLSTLSQAIFAGALAYPILGEEPTREFYAATVLVAAGMAAACWPQTITKEEHNERTQDRSAEARAR